jgi:hypothetical protein
LPSFSVTAAKKNVKLDRSGGARSPFTVTNTSAQTLKGRLLTRPSDPASPEWFSIVGEPVRDFAPNTPGQVDVQVDVPPGSPPGSYSFRLDAVSQIDPDEDFTEGPSVAFDVAPPPQPKKPFPWWIVAVVGGVVLLIVIGIVVFLLTRDDSPKATIVSSGAATIPGTFLFDVDTGTVVGIGPTADLIWRQRTTVDRQMAPQNRATIVNLGVTNFDKINVARLSRLNYSTAPIPGNADSTNQLVNGDVFAVHSTDGNFTKVKVVSYGFNLGIQWVTFRT